MSESGSTSSAILAPLDTANLQAQGLLLVGSAAGSRRIHKRRLNRSSDEEHRDIPLVTPPESSAAFVTIPDVLISRETLMHVGLSAENAGELWQKWTNWPQFGPRREVDPDDGGLQVTFIDFIVGHMENKDDAADESDAQWRACMDACGLSVDTQDAIMDPHFTYLRLSSSCLSWVRDTIEMRYAGLQDIQRTSRVREMELRRMASRPGAHQGEQRGGSQGGYTLDSASLPAATGQEKRRSISGQQQQGTPGVALDVWSSARAIASRNAPGYTVLYKGMDQARTNGLFDEAGALSNLSTLLSSAPSDFSSTRALFYFTPDVKVAEYYASYAKRRTECESVVILCLCIPNAAIEALSEPDIRRLSWPSNDWKELVWRCRTRQALPTRLRSYRNALLTIGTTPRRPDSEYHALGSWEDVTERFLLKVGANGGGDIATQYVVTGEDEGREWLKDNGARNIKVFPYTRVELDSWLAGNPPVGTA
ncbi:hypothetical protein B0T25DRAFT_291512 [Lasiosphaeria hispida]|uniref:Uncharacterized protein n=1 Tax=Lasiosphaeria hispida TaxID=260671 RepID=A0AAJ0HCA7_9PEZI|nr:hypothetical protein B0T25DRAFT_291512 [Lasiosphaeria hispida]